MSGVDCISCSESLAFAFAAFAAGVLLGAIIGYELARNKWR